MENIILIGMPGVGKSTVGVLLAKTLGYAFLDTDLLIQERQGVLLQCLVDELGVERFLDLEAEELAAISCQKTVLAPGGSAVCREKAARHLKALGNIVYLRLSAEALGERLHNMGSRGIAMKPGETLHDLLALRAPLYETCADLIVDVEGQTLEETVTAVRAAVMKNMTKGSNT